MDCVDCHNRPSHQYLPPEWEVDNAIRDGLIDRSLPFVRREAVRIIDQQFESHEAARAGIATELTAWYTENYPNIAEAQSADIEAAASTLGDLYSYNVFPHMEVWWNTYPEHSGHEASEGCFRCHNRRLRTEEREMISRDCDICHTVLAEEEENPAILTLLREGPQDEEEGE